MKTAAVILSLILIFSCRPATDIETAREEIFQTEKAFEKMVSEKGMADAFYHFADSSAAINRGNTIIAGKNHIKNYYEENGDSNATLNWTPDFIDVSDDGTMGYTYGRYTWRKRDSTGMNERSGVFHTVWRKQKDGTWKYVWD